MKAGIVVGIVALAGAAAASVGAYTSLRDGGGEGAAASAAYPAALTRALGGDPSRSSGAGGLALAAARQGSLGEVLRRHAEAEQILGRLADTGRPELRSRAANLRGALELQDAVLDRPRASTLLDAAMRDLQLAVRLDRGNEDAKFNLELLLTLRGGSNGSGGGAAASRPGGRQASQSGAKPQPQPAKPGAAKPGYGY